MNVVEKPSPLIGALIAIAGLIVAYLLLRFVPEYFRSGVAGALSGGFGVLAVSRVWPGLPIRRVHYWLGSVIAYGIVLGVVGRL